MQGLVQRTFELCPSNALSTGRTPIWGRGVQTWRRRQLINSFSSPFSSKSNSSASTTEKKDVKTKSSQQSQRVDETTPREDLLKEYRKLDTLVKNQYCRMSLQEEKLERMNEALQKQQEILDNLCSLGAAASIPPANINPFKAQMVGYGDRRLLGQFDARFHSTSMGATPKDYRILPERIVLVRHAQSEGNVDGVAYAFTPDSKVALTPNGHEQAREAGMKLRAQVEAGPGGADRDYKLFFYISPYRRSFQTYQEISACFPPDRISGVQEEVQLREQDFGNFQNPACKEREKADRVRFGRFFYRFPDGESGADVYDRLTIFEDHMIRDINAGRFCSNTTLVLITHGLSLRIFLMRWFHWTVEQFLSVYNPPNAEPLVLERLSDPGPGSPDVWRHTKTLYRIQRASLNHLKGCTVDMCFTGVVPQNVLAEFLAEAPTREEAAAITAASNAESRDQEGAVGNTAATVRAAAESGKAAAAAGAHSGDEGSTRGGRGFNQQHPSPADEGRDEGLVLEGDEGAAALLDYPTADSFDGCDANAGNGTSRYSGGPGSLDECEMESIGDATATATATALYTQQRVNDGMPPGAAGRVKTASGSGVFPSSL